MKRFIIVFFLFAVIGELMIRFDKSSKLFQEQRIIKIATNIEVTEEFKLISNNQFIFDNQDLRIMVIGDSYIHGGGINFQDNFSQQLKKIIISNNDRDKKIWVLDVSRASSNNLDNYNAYFQFVNKFKPNLLILGYNENDIEGALENNNNIVGLDIKNFKKSQTSSDENEKWIDKVYSTIKMSHFIHYVLHNVHNELKSFGIVFPNSRIDIVRKSYSENRVNWIKSKILLTQMINHAFSNEIRIIVYKLPDTNLLDNIDLNSKHNLAIKSYFENFPNVIYKDASLTLSNGGSKSYRLSKYDGHPNEKAHLIMAKDVYTLLVNDEKRTFD